jgi:hypothetical protein
MPNRQDKKGRSKTERWVQIPHFVIKSPAFRTLSVAARAVYLELLFAYHGSNNGRIGMSCRSAAERCVIAKNTSMKAFRELEERGFIECTKDAGFGTRSRLAPEWRLTHLKCDLSGRLPTKEFMRWGRHPLSQNVPTTVSNGGHGAIER